MAAFDLPPEWEEALDRAAAARRVAVLGPTDAGKSTFLHALAARRPGLALIDLDPGAGPGARMQAMSARLPTARAGRAPGRPVRIVRLGKMWAASGDEGWRLLERLAPAWAEGG